MAAGARQEPACRTIGISARCYQRWTEDGGVKKDQRSIVERPVPKNKLTDEDCQKIIEVVNSPEFANMAPCKIVPALADQGIYIASESSFYRVLGEERMNTHRGRTKSPVIRERSQPTLQIRPTKYGPRT